ncbi:hypothetical protein [Paenibacillus taichungensis]|uniref:hypothetical protein n=1 Tax=Paenibacillus taichungensis TaxID=484184 RepID=UPI0039A34D58
MKYTCKSCGEARFFYTEISVKAKQRIDLRNGSRHNKTYDIEPYHIDSIFEDIIYCGKCGEQVDMNEWEEYDG